MMKKPSMQDLVACMQHPEWIRNMCILAHVDHGKTTIADTLLVTNCIVSKRMAGSLRYLDDRMDEMERGITMKSSAVSLLNTIHIQGEEQPVLLNLIDTPGHIDFSSEVSAALRVCDGALIVVDLVEGVCVQTREAIKQAYTEKCKMTLLLNKFDKLVVDLDKTLDEMFETVRRAVEDCNAIIAELYRYEHDVDIEDSGLLFSPDTGNVIFASAIDGWGFTLRRIAATFLDKIKGGETIDSLAEKLWNFDAYVDSKCTVKLGATEKCKTNLFVQLCLKTIHHVYRTIVIDKDKDKTQSIADKLNVSIPAKDLNHSDAKVRLKAVMQAWSPLAETILYRCWKTVPAPSQIDEARVKYLLDYEQCSEENLETVDGLVKDFLRVDGGGETVAYVSKMFCVDSINLSQNKPKQFVPKARVDRGSEGEHNGTDARHEDKSKAEVVPPVVSDANSGSDSQEETEPDFEIMALARVFTGTLRPGQEVYVRTVNRRQAVEPVRIKDLYILFGKDLVRVDEVRAGNVCGISGMEAAIIRTATLSTSVDCVPFIENVAAPPVVRNAIEPTNPRDLPKLIRGLRTLMQSDSCVQVLVQETGEHVLLTAGDVHLAKCLEDLREKFAKIAFNVSSPMVSVRETVLTNFENKSEFRKVLEQTVDVEVKRVSLTVSVVALPNDLAGTLEKHHKVLRGIEEHQNTNSFEISNKAKGDLLPSSIKTYKRDAANATLQHTKDVVTKSFDEAGKFWSKMKTCIWSVGKTNDGINLLVNATGDDYHRNIFETLDETDPRSCFDHFVVNAFNTICKSGPLCEEPLQNCVFLVKKFALHQKQQEHEENRADHNTKYSVDIESSLSAAFKQAFAKQQQRLMEPMFTTDIQVNTNILGRVYTVISKRQGKVLDAVGMDDQERAYLVRAQIPVVESTGFANEIRSTTSGQAIANLKFSHFEIIDGDPFYEPVEDDEEEEGVNVDLAKRATKLRKDIRRRKGLFVDEQVVVHAEKQRTLNKKK